MKGLFENLKLTWPKVIIFAVIIGIYTGIVMLIPALKDTSFQDIGISYEWWVIFAVIIVVNCGKSVEAMLKCFVFFLISQPIIYLVEILFGSLSFELAWGYYCSMWLPMTFLTLPGGFIAYFCKGQNIMGAVILGLGNTILSVMALAYFGMTIKDFPHHILSGIVCILSIIIMSSFIQKEKKCRFAAFTIPIFLTAVILVFLKMTGRVLF